MKITFEVAETVAKLLKNGYKMRQLKGDEKLSLRRNLILKVEEIIVKKFPRNPKCLKKQGEQQVTRFSV